MIRLGFLRYHLFSHIFAKTRFLGLNDIGPIPVSSTIFGSFLGGREMRRRHLQSILIGDDSDSYNSYDISDLYDMSYISSHRIFSEFSLLCLGLACEMDRHPVH